jgi:hypothetical protein
MPLFSSTCTAPCGLGARQLTADIVIPDLCTIESKLDISLQENWSIESKAEVISSKIDTVSPISITPEL